MLKIINPDCKKLNHRENQIGFPLYPIIIALHEHVLSVHIHNLIFDKPGHFNKDERTKKREEKKEGAT